MILTWNSYTVCNFSPVKRRAGKTLINRHPHETRREALPRAGSVGDSPRRLFEGERREETKNTIMNHGSWQWFQWNSMVSDVCFINDRCWWLFGSFLFVIFCSWNVVTRCCKKLSSKIDQSDLDGIWEASKVNLLAKLAQRVHGNFSDPKLPKLKFATRREKWILQARLVPWSFPVFSPYEYLYVSVYIW